MKIKNPKFVISAVSDEQYPKGDLLEIAFAGRSNVGKSSLINALLGRKRLAYSGSRQGMTRQINFYDIDGEILFVDLPGYGYASGSRNEQGKWRQVTDSYLNTRESLYLIILLLDIRLKPTNNDIDMYRWILESELNYIIVANKRDKLNNSEIKKAMQDIRDVLKLTEDTQIYDVSSENGYGIKELWSKIDSYIVIPD